MTKRSSGEDFFKDPEAARKRKLEDLNAELSNAAAARARYEKMSDGEWEKSFRWPDGWTRTRMIEQFRAQEASLKEHIALLEQNGAGPRGAR